MNLQETITKVAFGTKVAVRKNGKVKHFNYSDVKDIVQLKLILEEEVQCLYVENNELLIDLDSELDYLLGKNV